MFKIMLQGTPEEVTLAANQLVHTFNISKRSQPVSHPTNESYIRVYLDAELRPGRDGIIRIGDLVEYRDHPEFGMGKVIEAGPLKALVHFEHADNLKSVSYDQLDYWERG